MYISFFLQIIQFFCSSVISYCFSNPFATHCSVRDSSFPRDHDHSLFGHWRLDEGVVSCDGTGPVVHPLLLGGLVELEHGEGLLGAGHLAHAHDDPAAALEDRV